MMISEEPIGGLYPYNTKDKQQIEIYIQDLFYTINRSKSIKCEAIFDHYGSGYASYVDFFCYKKDGSSVINESYIEKDSLISIQIEGFVIYISRLAPVAIFGTDIRHKAILDNGKDEFFSGMGMISHPNGIINEPPRHMVNEFQEIKEKLISAGYYILNKDYLSQPLPFETKIQTFTRPNQYTIFDAFFYWKD
ncbi:hypothetical protein SAMN05880501_1196 [Ureibacillus xyleni]|uniref:Uncharacterized protein n=2 Tax=Ureibacillus xyleni TaxID=614648 RepID=A0A285TQZ0_9BACL|nr:hypothetical protein SAMN05880501_1196 [Ureibacillus xyleni]